MWKKIAIAAAGSAAIVGVGTAALAASGTGSPVAGLAPSVSPTASTTGSTTTGTPAAKHDKQAKGGLIKRVGAVAHASWVSKEGAKFVTHDAIHGSVTGVTATSITVKAGDGVSQTYSVSSATKVRVRTAGKGSAGTIADVKTGQFALVTGTGTTALSAAHIETGLKK